MRFKRKKRKQNKFINPKSRYSKKKRNRKYNKSTEKLERDLKELDSIGRYVGDRGTYTDPLIDLEKLKKDRLISIKYKIELARKASDEAFLQAIKKNNELKENSELV